MQAGCNFNEHKFWRDSSELFIGSAVHTLQMQYGHLMHNVAKGCRVLGVYARFTEIYLLSCIWLGSMMSRAASTHAWNSLETLKLRNQKLDREYCLAWTDWELSASVKLAVTSFHCLWRYCKRQPWLHIYPWPTRKPSQLQARRFSFSFLTWRNVSVLPWQQQEQIRPFGKEYWRAQKKEAGQNQRRTCTTGKSWT